MSLSVVIPAYRCAATIGPLIASLLAAPYVGEIVVVDDASGDETGAAVLAAGNGDPRLRLITAAENGGAGAARNLGIAEITEPYTLFLDSDDAIDALALGEALAYLDRFGGDFILFRYSTFDRDPAVAGPMNGLDVNVWQKVMGERELVGFTLAEGGMFLATVNFPWTKIHRTERLHEIGLRFSETAVHNDIFAHWLSYLEATSFIAFNRVCVHHRVSASDHHLNNQKGRSRFDAFVALDEVDRLFEGRPDRDAYYPIYSFFRINLLNWIHGQMPPDLVGEFQRSVGRAFAAFDAERYRACRQAFAPVADLCVRARLSPASLYPGRERPHDLRGAP
jgi:glycosyltransferase involved in cell wall biosynthesis